MRKILTPEERADHLARIRENAEREMAEMGVDRAFIGQLVETFYDRIKDHPNLGSIFNDRLEGRWGEHLIKMKRFWSAIAFKDGAYGGKPVAAHQPLPGLYPGLFLEWLALFSATLDDIAPTPKAHQWFMTTADRIAKSLVMALFYNPAVDDPALKNLSS